MHDAIQLPLGLDLRLVSQGEAVQAQVAQVPEHRFHGSDAPMVDGLAREGVNLALHNLREGLWLAVLAREEADLTDFGPIRQLQAAAAQMTRAAGRLRRSELHGRVAVDGDVAAVDVERLSRWTEASVPVGVVAEVPVGESVLADVGVRSCFMHPSVVGRCGSQSHGTQRARAFDSQRSGHEESGGRALGFHEFPVRRRLA